MKQRKQQVYRLIKCQLIFVNKLLQKPRINLKICVHGAQNPFGVDYIRYSPKATQTNPVVYVEIYNNTNVNSPTGTLNVSIGKTTATAWEKYSLYVPSIKPGEILKIPVYLKYGNMSEYAYGLQEEGKSAEPLTFRVSIDYNVPDIVAEAKKQDAKGTDPNRPDKYVWDKDPKYTYTKDHFDMMKELGLYELYDSWK